MESTFKMVTDFLDDHHVPYEIVAHAAVFTSEQAAKVRGTSLEQGAKALLFKGKHGFVLAVLPGNRRVDSRKLKKLLGVKDLRFATPEEVKATMHCEIGSCYPFGNLIGVHMVVDQSLSDDKRISFNAGLHTRSVMLDYADYARVVSPEVRDIAQNTT